MNSSLSHLVFALGTLIIVLGGYAWWYSVVSNESATAVRLLQEVEVRTDATTRASAVSTALARIESEQGAIEDYFISEENIVAFLEDIEQIGLSTGARVQVVSVGDLERRETTLPLSVVIEGGFNAVMRTVGAVEYMPYAVTTVSASVQQITNEEGAVWRARLDLTVGITPS
jgi:Tfp pilus assembly protein PilO